jgi:hypothetical protein
MRSLLEARQRKKMPDISRTVTATSSTHLGQMDEVVMAAAS